MNEGVGPSKRRSSQLEVIHDCRRNIIDGGCGRRGDAQRSIPPCNPLWRCVFLSQITDTPTAILFDSKNQ